MCSAAGTTCLLQAAARDVLPPAALPCWAWGTTCPRPGPEQEIGENQQQRRVTLSPTLVITAWLHPRTAGAIASLKPLFCASSSNSQAEKCAALQISRPCSRSRELALENNPWSSVALARQQHPNPAPSRAQWPVIQATLLGKHPPPPSVGTDQSWPPPPRRQQTALHVRVPTLPMALPACCPPPAGEAALRPLIRGDHRAQCR